MMKKILGVGTALHLVLFAQAFATQALAQEATRSVASAGDKQASELGEIVVTGTRLRNKAFVSPSPIQVITAEGAAQRGLMDTTEMVQQTVAAGATQQIESASSGRPSTGGGGSTTIGLRGLGAARTLVLLNGRRVGLSGSGGTIGGVDLSMIPSPMVERVETMTNGASAIYGSDAVAGVINIITREDFDGGRITLNGAQTEDGGGNYYTLAGRYGHTFDRGAISGGLSWQKTEVLYAKDRDATSCDADYVFNADGSRADILGTDGNPKCWGVGYLYKYASTGTGGTSYAGYYAGYLRPDSTATSGLSTNYYSDLNGYARIRQSSQSTTDQYNGYYDAESGGLTDGDQSMISPSERTSVYLTGNYQISNNVEVYGELLGTHRRSRQEYLRWFQAGTINASNPNNPFNYANNPNYVDSSGKAIRAATSTMLFQIQQDPEQTVDFFNAVGGLRGSARGDWTWDVFANASRSKATYSQKYVYADRLAAASGANGCDTSLLTTATSCPTGGIDFWSAYENGFTEEEAAWLFGRNEGKTTYDTFYVEGSVSGTLIQLPAGPLSSAFGFHLRREAIDDFAGDSDDVSTTALSYYQSSTPTVGSAKTAEAFAEFAVPLLNNLRFARRLDLSLSGRASNFEYGGSAFTYKAGLTWMPSDWLMFRATQGTSFRSPKLYELFLQDQSALSARTGIDVCTNYLSSSSLNDKQKARCSTIFGGAAYTASGNATVYTGGSTDLEPETSITRTIGFVVSPSFADTHLSVDYYDIHIDNSVTRLGSSNIVSECLNADDYDTSPYCALITRDSTGQITSIRNDYMNTGDQYVKGVDLLFDIAFGSPIGRLGFDTELNYQFENATEVFAGNGTVDYAGRVGYPEFRGNAGIWYRPNTKVYLRLSAEMTGRQSNASVDGTTGAYRTTGTTVYYDRVAEFYTNTTLSGAFRVKSDIDLTTGVRNLFDVDAPSLSSGGSSWAQYREGTSSTLSFYDRRGRTFYVNVSKSF